MNYVTPGGSEVKNPPANARDKGDAGLIPGLGRSPGEGNGYPLQCSCLENPMNRGAWQATIHRVAKSRTVLSNSTPMCNTQWVIEIEEGIKQILVFRIYHSDWSSQERMWVPCCFSLSMSPSFILQEFHPSSSTSCPCFYLLTFLSFSPSSPLSLSVSICLFSSSFYLQFILLLMLCPYDVLGKVFLNHDHVLPESEADQEELSTCCLQVPA